MLKECEEKDGDQDKHSSSTKGSISSITHILRTLGLAWLSGRLHMVLSLRKHFQSCGLMMCLTDSHQSPTMHLVNKLIFMTHKHYGTVDFIKNSHQGFAETLKKMWQQVSVLLVISSNLINSDACSWKLRQEVIMTESPPSAVIRTFNSCLRHAFHSLPQVFQNSLKLPLCLAISTQHTHSFNGDHVVSPQSHNAKLMQDINKNNLLWKLSNCFSC